MAEKLNEKTFQVLVCRRWNRDTEEPFTPTILFLCELTLYLYLLCMCCVKSEVSVELDSQRSHYLILPVLLFELDVRVAPDWPEEIQISCWAAVQPDSWLMTESSWGHQSQSGCDDALYWRLKGDEERHTRVTDSFWTRCWSAEHELCSVQILLRFLLFLLIEGKFAHLCNSLQVSCVYLNWTPLKPEHLHALFIFAISFYLGHFTAEWREDIYVLIWDFK